MAGIGFSLQRMLAKRSLNATLRAYSIGALVSSGPWALSILALGLIGILCQREIDRQHVTLFFATVTNIYAFSLILTGPLQLVVTRYIADTIYLRRAEEVIPSLFATLLVAAAALEAIGLPVVLTLELEPAAWVGMLALLAVVGGIWITMLYISASRRYDRIFVAFLIGSTVSVAAAMIGSRHLGFAGLLWGYLFGQSVLLYSLMTVIALEFPRGRGLSFRFLHHFRLHPRLAAVGLAINLAIWIDKILFWHHPEAGVRVLGFLRVAPVYDLPAYLAYLAIIPGMAFFTVRIETDLAEAYSRYFDRVLNRRSLGEIRAVQQAMADILAGGTRRLLHIQGLVCLALILLAPALVEALALRWVHLPVLQVQLVGVLPQLLVIVAMTALYYFDAQSSALVVSVTFVLTNALATAATLALGPSWYGYGIVVAAMLTAAVGILAANREINDLDYHTFMRPKAEAAAPAGEELETAA